MKNVIALFIASLSTGYMHEANAEADCQGIASDARSAVSFNDANLAAEVLANPDAKFCLLPEHFNALHQVQQKSKGIIIRNQIQQINPEEMKGICAATALMQNSLDIEATKWIQVNSNTFNYNQYYCQMHYTPEETFAEIRMHP